jgi:hypothetical protein
LSAWAKNELQEPAALALGADFAAPNEVAFRDDADELTGRVDDQEPTDVPLQHGGRGFDDRSLRSDSDNGSSHDLMGA